jgi:ketosteroid isomerase-like protein
MSDLAELHTIRERLAAAENAYNANVLVDLMAEDVVLMVPDFPVQEGREACARFIRGVTDFFRETASRRITYASAEVRVTGDVAYDRGTFSFTFTSNDGLEDVVETGKYFWLYTRAAGSGWKIWRTIVSLDQREDED